MRSYHLKTIIQLTIRSLLDFGNNILQACSKTLKNKFDVIYNAALRIVTGLPLRTPIPIIRKETDNYTFELITSLLASKFFDKHAALRDDSPIFTIFNQHFNNRLKRSKPPITILFDYLNLFNISKDSLIPFFSRQSA